MPVQPVLQAAGATRFCMDAAWRNPKGRDVVKVAEIIGQVKAMGLETCATLGELDDAQARRLKAAALGYYNHNLDTSDRFYEEKPALCFLAGANSIFYGEKLLTTGNPGVCDDPSLFRRLGLRFEEEQARGLAALAPRRPR